MSGSYLSVVIPVLNEEKNIIPVYQGLKEVLDNLKINFEVIFVDDGSRDHTFQMIEKINNLDKRVRAIKFLRNFGKAAAYMAGFKESRGEVIVTMDGDLQDDPRDIPYLLEVLNSGYDLVTGWKCTGKSSKLKFIASKIFNRLIALFVGLKIHDLNCPLKIYRRQVAQGLNLYSDLYRYTPIIVHDMGYKVGEIKVKNLPRVHGKSKYKGGKYFKSFLDFITIYFLIRYSRKPLHFFGVAGMLFGFLGTMIGIYLLVEKLLFNIEIMKEHGPLTMLTVLLIIVGFQMVSFGLLAEMLTRIYQKENRQEVYSVERMLN